MVTVRPVQAYHPASADASELVAPVYDTISDADLARLARHRFNAARFVARPSSQGVDQFVREATRCLREAIAAGVYVQDASPGLYVYGIRYVPPPDIDLAEEGDPDDSLQEAQTLAGDGQSALKSTDNDPFDGLVRESQAAIDREATGVGLTEEVNLLTDERESGLDASDFGQEVCNAIGAVKGSLSIAQIYVILDHQHTRGSNDVKNVIKNGDRRFTQAFGSRFDTLDAAERIVEDIENLFC